MDKKEERFHRNRVMFCITADHVVHAAPPDNPRSHEKWFRDENWIDNKPEVFLLTTTRGFYYPETNCFYAYFGREYSYDKDTIQTIWVNIHILRDLLGLNDETQIVFGPKDQFFHGQSYRQLFCGTLTEFVGKVYDQIN
jgi:hypothetical protein